MLYNAGLAQDFARELYTRGIYAIGFFFPVVPQGQARIRTQLSADHDHPTLAMALDVFKQVGEHLGILGMNKKEIVAKYGA